MDLINERNKQTISLESENKKTVLDSLENELISRAETIEQQAEMIKDLTTPVNQLAGQLFELNYINDMNLIPWAAILPLILNSINETKKDTGIDVVVIDRNQIKEIVQIKCHMDTYLRNEEMDTFLSKATQDRHKNIQKQIVIHGCKLEKCLRHEIDSLGIEIMIV